MRRRTQNETLGHRGRSGDPLYGIRRLLLVGGERLELRGRHRMMAGLAAGDPEGEVGAAVLAKELLREGYVRIPTPNRSFGRCGGYSSRTARCPMTWLVASSPNPIHLPRTRPDGAPWGRVYGFGQTGSSR